MLTLMAKEERLQIRATAAQKAMLSRAAEATGTSLSEFMLRAAVRDAEDAILDQKVFVLAVDEYEAQKKQLFETPDAKERVERLINRKTRWDS